jgi:hypothetical protein
MYIEMNIVRFLLLLIMKEHKTHLFFCPSVISESFLMVVTGVSPEPSGLGPGLGGKIFARVEVRVVGLLGREFVMGDESEVVLNGILSGGRELSLKIGIMVIYMI